MTAKLQANPGGHGSITVMCVGVGEAMRYVAMELLSLAACPRWMAERWESKLFLQCKNSGEDCKCRGESLDHFRRFSL
jgi:hypothetical protein